MKIGLLILLSVLYFFQGYSSRQEEYTGLFDKLGISDLAVVCDTVGYMNWNGYDIRFSYLDATPAHIGLNLFGEHMKHSSDREILECLETLLLGRVLGVDLTGSTELVLRNGSLEDLKKISVDTPCNINISNASHVFVEWLIDSTEDIGVVMPIDYLKIKGGCRAELENAFIESIGSSFSLSITKPQFDGRQLHKHSEGYYVAPGAFYLHEDINRNLYFSEVTDMTPICSLEWPAESISNILLSPSPMLEEVDVDLTVLTHSPGHSVQFSVPLVNILAACERDGCQLYWGVEEYGDDGILQGSLFCHNTLYGYDHVINIKCNPREVLIGKGKMHARASLYIPVYNVDILTESVSD